MSTDKTSRKYGTVSIPMGILEAIDALIDELRYWPSRGSFVREACLEKVRSERNRLRELKNLNNHAQAGGLTRDQPPIKPET